MASRLPGFYSCFDFPGTGLNLPIPSKTRLLICLNYNSAAKSQKLLYISAMKTFLAQKSFKCIFFRIRDGNFIVKNDFDRILTQQPLECNLDSFCASLSLIIHTSKCNIGSLKILSCKTALRTTRVSKIPGLQLCWVQQRT